VIIVDSCCGACVIIADAEETIEGYWGMTGVSRCPMGGPCERATASVISGE
jgi:hypothetical protein